MEKPRLGERAPDFSLQDQNEAVFKLSEFENKNILLSFHPLARTSICAEQMKALEKNQSIFDSVDAIALGLSIDTVPSKKAWADHLKIKNLRLLSDFWPHGEIAALYGVFREKDGFSERANIIIDKKKKILFFKVYPLGELPDIQEVIRKLHNIS